MMHNKWSQIPHSEGVISRQAHADFPEQGRFEREVSRNGFFGPATHLHHQHPPTGWTDWEGPLRPRLFNLNELNAHAHSPWQAPSIAENSHCRLRFWRCDQPMPFLVRNADGDDLLFVHAGKGHFFCDYGHLEYTDGDYILIPRGTLWRVEPTKNTTVLMIENTNGHYELPDKGIVGQHALFDPMALDCPKIDAQFQAQQGECAWQIKVKRHNQTSTITYPFNPLDAVGWHGDIYPVRINWRHIRPLMSHRYHLPPSAHTTFVASGFIICTFVPRPIESDPGALKVPFYHSNEEYDEILFYHSGNFFSRDNIDKGMLSFHPSGFTHGPHPKAFEAGNQNTKTETDEVAVMIDTRDAMKFNETSDKIEIHSYIDSWKKDTRS